MTKHLMTLGNNMSKVLINKCDNLASFWGTQCFKIGVAFDKMGYYSIFLNIYISMFYNKLILNVNDSIALCMYFGLLCNGTLNWTSIWSELQKQLVFAKQFYKDKGTDKTRTFHLLVMLDKDKRKDSTNRTVGNCKLPQFQFTNYSEYVIGESETIHNHIKDILMARNSDVNTIKVFQLQLNMLHYLRFFRKWKE